MQISLRSQLVAGTAAVVGASAIAMTPVVAHHDLQLPAIQIPAASAEVALAGYDSPVSELFRSLGQLNNFVFGSGNTLADYPGILSLAGLTGIQTVYNFNAAGIFPQIINDAAPILRQLGTNGSAYLDTTFNAIYRIGFDLSEGVWNAAGQALTLDIPGAVSTLVAAVQSAGTTALQAGNFVLTNVIAKTTALISAIPAVANLVVTAVTGQAQVLVGAVSTFANALVAAVQTGNPETIWNTTVDGLFGPNGLPGVINKLTVGAGVQTGPATIVPSVRGVIQATVKGITTALQATSMAPPVTPPASAVSSSPSVASASALRSAAADEPSTTAGDNTKSDEGSSAGAGDNATPGDNATSGDNGSSGAGSASNSDNGSKGGAKGKVGNKRAHKAPSKSAD